MTSNGNHFQIGDWVVFGFSVGQIKNIDAASVVTFSDGWFETSGRLLDRMRPLTLRNKRTVERFSTVYDRLRSIDGERGFNFPDIAHHFEQLALKAMDADAEQEKQFFDAASEFVVEAKQYQPVIQGVRLFRRSLSIPGIAP